MSKKTFLFLIIFVVVGFYGSLFANPATLEGEKLYQRKCSRCHTAYEPHKYSGEEWETIMREMGALSGLDEQEEKTILNYLEESSHKKEKKLPTAPVLGGYLYSEFFSSKDKVDTFDIHYLNINLSGRIHKNVTYRAEFEIEHGGGEADPPFVEQAYLDVWFSRSAALRIGAILTPFNRFDDFHGPIENYLVTRPQMSREIGNSAWKEVGIDFHGNFRLSRNVYVNYDLYVLNGLGSGSRLRKSRQYKDNNNAKSFGMRLSGIFWDNVEVGGSFYRGAWDDAGNFDLTIYGAHLLARLGDFNLMAEYASARSENPDMMSLALGSMLEDGEADGYFVQASYLLGGKFRPTVRYGTLDYFDQGSMFGRSPTDYDTKVIAFGFNFYLTPGIVFKIEYDIVQEGERKTEKDNNVLALQAAVSF